MIILYKIKPNSIDSYHYCSNSFRKHILNEDTAHDGEYWEINGELHREFLPAIKYKSGAVIYLKNNKEHRLDGPAIIIPNGEVCRKIWYIEGKRQKDELDYR